MNIIIVSGGYPSSKTPLGGIFEFDQAQALQSLGNKVVFISLDLRSIRRWRSWRLQRFEQDGIIVYQYPIPLGNIPAKWVLFWAQRGLLKLYKIIVQEQGTPDIVHAHFTLIAAVVSILKQKFSLPYVVTEHSSKINRKKIDSKTKFFAAKAYGNADQLISVSSLLANRINIEFGYESKVIANIVDSRFLSPVCTSRLSHPFRFISVGNLLHRKGFDLLIEAFAKAKLPETVQLDIIGSGECQSKLQNMINLYHLEQRIHLLGFRNRDEIAAQMQESSVFVLASRVETFGVVYIEALLAGLPVIATSCGGPEDFVNDSNGILVPTENVDALKDALEIMYSNCNNYNRNYISEMCFRRFSPEKIGREILSVYDNILNQS